MGVLRVACLFSLRFLCLMFEFVICFVSMWFRGVDFLMCVLVSKVRVWRMVMSSLCCGGC